MNPSNRIICLHGFLGAPEDWVHFAATAGAEYRLIPIALPGHGSPLAPSFDAAVDQLVSAVRAHAPVHLVGYSMGGRLALAVALRLSRERVIQSLSIISATPGIRAGVERAQRAIADDRLADVLERQGLQRFVREWYRQPLFQSLEKRPALLRELMARRSAGSAKDRADALRALTVGRMPDYWDQLGSLSCPALWMAGELDRRYSGIARRAALLCPAGFALTVPDAGHAPHIERPWYVTEQILQWLATSETDVLCSATEDSCRADFTKNK